MGNEELCRVECSKVDPREITPFKESACIEMIDNLPRVKGKFNFTKQTAFNKIERAASQYCSSTSPPSRQQHRPQPHPHRRTPHRLPAKPLLLGHPSAPRAPARGLRPRPGGNRHLAHGLPLPLLRGQAEGTGPPPPLPRLVPHHHPSPHQPCINQARAPQGALRGRVRENAQREGRSCPDGCRYC